MACSVDPGCSVCTIRAGSRAVKLKHGGQDLPGQGAVQPKSQPIHVPQLPHETGARQLASHYIQYKNDGGRQVYMRIATRAIVISPSPRREKIYSEKLKSRMPLLEMRSHPLP